MSADVGDALLGFRLGSGLGPRGKREDSCVLPFIEPRQQHDLAIGKFERVMIGVKHAPVVPHRVHDVAVAQEVSLRGAPSGSDLWTVMAGAPTSVSRVGRATVLGPAAGGASAVIAADKAGKSAQREVGDQAAR